MAIKHMEICSIVSHGEMPIEAIITSHPLGWLELKRQTITGADKDMEKSEPSPGAGGNKCKMEQILWKTLAVPQKVTQSCPMTQQFHS